MRGTFSGEFDGGQPQAIASVKESLQYGKGQQESIHNERISAPDTGRTAYDVYVRCIELVRSRSRCEITITPEEKGADVQA